MTEADLIYAAAIIDGEGSVGFHKRPHGNALPVERVQVGNTDPRLILWLFETFGGYVGSNRRIGAKPTHRPMKIWVVSALKANSFLLMVRPYMKLKGEQADLLIAHRKLARGGNGRKKDAPGAAILRLDIHRQVSELNRRGVAG